MKLKELVKELVSMNRPEMEVAVSTGFLDKPSDITSVYEGDYGEKTVIYIDCEKYHA